GHCSAMKWARDVDDDAIEEQRLGLAVAAPGIAEYREQTHAPTLSDRGQIEIKLGAVAEPGLDGKLTTVVTRKPVRDRESEARTLIAALGREEGIEDAREHVIEDPRAVVVDHHSNPG